ncbi:MAG: 2-hydroxyacyl-CoA dehydratase [Desulfobacteraceae bacterium]|nr:2-hydroxyacyl-CoA dehydratase [Desulfobacteraceae bacterium]
MEDRLRGLIDGNRPENRSKWAVEWKSQGKKVMGVLCTYVPEEIISAAGVLPWRVTGTWEEAAPNAALYRPEMTCRYCSHVLESVLTGDLDFLDGVVTTQIDDDFKRLWDVLDYIKKPPFAYIMYLPHKISKTCLRMWNSVVLEFKEAVEEFADIKITDDELHRQIEIYNTMRGLLRKVYELGKREAPPLTGAEILGLTTTARVMPKEEFNKELESLLPYIEKRRASFKEIRPRLLLGGEYLDNPAYVQLVEDSGAAVVMNEFDTGSKYFWSDVNASKAGPLEAIADRYMNRPETTTSRMNHWKEQFAQLMKWIKEFNVDGIIELRQLYSLPLDYRFFFFKKKFEDADISYLSVSREYHLSHVGMLRTRFEAFIEMID